MMEAHKEIVEMVPTKTRSRSNTAASSKGRKRPQSRASTTSVHSTATQSVIDQHLTDPSPEYKSWYDNNDQSSQRRFGAMDGHMTPEDMVLQSASQLQNPREYGIDPALEAAVNQVYPPDGVYRPENSRQSLPADGYGTSFVEDDSPMLEDISNEHDDVDSVAGANGVPKKAAKSSAANELEMRQLFQSNKHRTLPDVARELFGNERGPQSERIRQVFAMLWINQVCDKGKGSVPRGRVYANYVSRCATERVTVLNPASFGKLVRVLFPGLKTRRLGVRGESKYHYVNFSLQEDQPELIESQNQLQIHNYEESTRFAPDSSIHSNLPADRAVFPTPGVYQLTDKTSQANQDPKTTRSLYNRPVVSRLQEFESVTGKMEQRLCFAPPSEDSMNEYEAISLPKIDPYVPTGTDPDSATALTALYRSHCTSLVDAIRFVKQKTFFHLFTSFHGTLTMPVQKLFANPSIAPWIEECDFVMYQKMIRVVSHLTLEVVPPIVLDTLRTISERLVPHIQTAFQGHPAHVIHAKVAPATLFAGLVDRMCRVNMTAHAAANMLSHSPNRDQMYEDWITLVGLRKVAENVPTRAMDDVAMLLLSELRELMDPIGVTWEIEGPTIYGEMALRNGRQQQSNILTDNSIENVLDRWVGFLISLPERFPYATPADIIACVQTVGSAVMRDLTIKSAQSFGAWWVTKCWIDEMILFMAEKGGFMEYKTTRTFWNESPSQSIKTGLTVQLGSHLRNGAEGFNRLSHGINNLNRGVSIPGPMEATSQAAINAAAGHDDSGIGMPSPDDNFSMSKFNFNDTPLSATNLESSASMHS